ncbi:hypothetical protein AMAG_20726 [Allomyces macrogynus ATCC 38327]|uniref:Exonuclease domain-containing protein n=1 Tax=Allomyces macrogynus (strain ATCC 38327) TaxID=578462 RepID=A0A0L0TF13_ALLM3|nr:hypothetical protein AMAG_20726 [Allomyces macrogynus ATCC 38327]|eukprot:KNE73246.1 hypothetical protein AMAG_20726 [Allomyces macrogynus ATCC 38327]
MFLNHPKHLVRDTASYAPFHEALRTSNPALRNLARAFLGLTVQQGEHDSIEDARVAMLLYRLHRDDWEQFLRKLAKGEVKLPMSSKRKKSSQHWDPMRNKNKPHKAGRVENNKRGKGRPQQRGKPIGGDAA